MEIQSAPGAWSTPAVFLKKQAISKLNDKLKQGCEAFLRHLNQQVGDRAMWSYVKDRNHGISPFIPLYVDMRLFVVHEKVEIIAKNAGLGFKDAHEVATHFEKIFRQCIYGPETDTARALPEKEQAEALDWQAGVKGDEGKLSIRYRKAKGDEAEIEMKIEGQWLRLRDLFARDGYNDTSYFLPSDWTENTEMIEKLLFSREFSSDSGLLTELAAWQGPISEAVNAVLVAPKVEETSEEISLSATDYRFPLRYIRASRRVEIQAAYEGLNYEWYEIKGLLKNAAERFRVQFETEALAELKVADEAQVLKILNKLQRAGSFILDIDRQQIAERKAEESRCRAYASKQQFMVLEKKLP